jgi:hypothetical protein
VYERSVAIHGSMDALPSGSSGIAVLPCAARSQSAPSAARPVRTYIQAPSTAIVGCSSSMSSYHRSQDSTVATPPP